MSAWCLPDGVTRPGGHHAITMQVGTISRTSRRMVRTMEKSRARRTSNDAPLPKVNWYLSHVCFIRFSTFSLHLICFSPLHVLNFQNCFFHAGIFLALFPFYRKTKNIFWVLKSFGKNNLNIFLSKLLAVHHISKVHNRWISIWPKGGTRGPTLGPADPTGRPTQDQRLLGLTFFQRLPDCCAWLFLGCTRPNSF